MPTPEKTTYAKIERVEYKDLVLGLVNLREKNGEWTSEQGLKITAEKGKIVVSINIVEGNESRSIVRRFESSAKLDSLDFKDSKAKIDVKIKVNEEEGEVAQLMEQVKRGVKEPIYKNHKMTPEPGVLAFREPGKGWILIEIIKDDRELGAVVVESSIHNSVERVDTKKFSLDNKLLIFDSATEHGKTPEIKVRNEELGMDELLSKPNVKLREIAKGQFESKKPL